MNELEHDRAMQEPRKCPQCSTSLPAGVLDGLCPACLLQQGASADTATQPEQPPFEPPPLAELTKLFPQLEVLSLIGKGGMGAVYKARQPALDRFVALKILPAQPSSGPAFAERFNREARALARLSHPNIVGVHEFGATDGLHYFIMEFVDGVNLRQLEKSGRLSPREALQIIPQICDALQYAHDEGVVHRDIKPENVLVDRKGRVKIADFGLAKILGREPADLRLTGEGQVMGTPHYMAPEQIEHPLEVDHRADIYSLGVVFYEMLTGELPLGKFAPPSRKVQVDVRLDEVVLHALEKEPQHRYQHASQVKTDVVTIASAAEQPPVIEPASDSVAVTERIRRQVKGPAIGLLMTGIANWILIPLVLTLLMPHAAAAKGAATPQWVLVVIALTPLALCSFIIFASVRMRQLESWGLAVAASVLAAIVTPGNIIGLPLGIWSLAVLTRRDVREAFRATRQGATANGTRILGSAGGTARPQVAWWPWAVGGLVVLVAIVGMLLVQMAASHRSQPADTTALLRRIGVPADLAGQGDDQSIAIQGQVADIQADGLIRFQSVVQVPNDSDKTLTVYRFVNSDFVNVEKITDVQNRSIRFDSRHVNRRFEYTLPLGAPVPPGGVVSFIMEGTMTGLVKPVVEPDGFEYYMHHSPGSRGPTRRIEVHRLPAGAELLKSSPDKLRQQTNDGRIELSIDEVIPPKGSLEVRYNYRLPSAPKLDVIAAVDQAVQTISQCAEGDPRVEEAMQSLRTQNASEVVTALLPHLDSTMDTIRRSAVYVLWKGEFTDITSASGALQRLLSHREEFTRGMAALALGQNHVGAAFDALVKMTAEDRSGYARRCAAHALGLLGDARAEPTLKAALNDPDPLVKGNAAKALELLRQKQHSSADAAVSAAPFLARLPHGEIELVAISYHPSTNQPWWRPDGTLWSEGPFTTSLRHEPAFAGARVREFVLRGRGLPADASWPAWQIGNSSGSASDRVTAPGGLQDKELRVIAAALQDPVAQITVKIGVASGPWQTVLEQVPAPSQAEQDAAPEAKTDKRLLDVTVEFHAPGQEVRAIAVDAHGVEHGATRLRSTGKGPISQYDAQFELRSAVPITNVLFQMRPRDWVEFRNVALEPMNATRKTESPDFGPGFESVATEPEDLRRARAKLAELRGKFTEENPQVQAVLRQIRNLLGEARDASAEVWSPTLQPGEKPDPDLIRQEAEQLARNGQFEEALQRHIWYHNHALEYGVGQGGVRLSFALSAWVELGRKYPKARQALVEIRDRKARELHEGRGHSDLFQDVAGINHYLKEEDATFALFKTLLDREPELAKRCYFYAEDLLVEKGEYSLCLSLFPDFRQRFELIRHGREIALAFQERRRKDDPSMDRSELNRQPDDQFVKQTRKLIEILVGAGQLEDAEKIRDQAVAILEDDRLKSAVDDARKKTGK